MPMRIVETTVLPQSVRLVLANTDTDPATERIVIEVPIGGLKRPSDDTKPLEPPEECYLAEVQRSVLHRARSVVGVEIQRLARLEGRLS